MGRERLMGDKVVHGGVIIYTIGADVVTNDNYKVLFSLLFGNFPL